MNAPIRMSAKEFRDGGALLASVELPWPSRTLHPNERPHFMEKARATKKARGDAYSMSRRLHLPTDTPLRVTMVFTPPTYHARDVDGLVASCKAYLDGIADATGINDRNFHLGEPRIAPHRAPGKVVFEIEVVT